MTNSMQEDIPGAVTRDRPFIAIQPDEWIKFTNDHMTQQIWFRNLTHLKVAFKIRLSNVNDYTVKPNCGFIEPNDSAKTELTLQDNYQSQRPHRVMIMAADPNGESDRHKVWEHYLPNSKDVQLHKLFVSLPKEVVTKVVQNYIPVTVPPQTDSQMTVMKSELEKVHDEHNKLRTALEKLKKEKPKSKPKPTPEAVSTEPIMTPSSTPTSSKQDENYKLIMCAMLVCFALLLGYQMGGSGEGSSRHRSYRY